MSDSTNRTFCAGYQGRKALQQLQQELETPIIVKFSAPHCPSCETLAPVLEQLVTDYIGKIHLVTIDITEDPEFAIAKRCCKQRALRQTLQTGWKTVSASTSSVLPAKVRWRGLVGNLSGMIPFSLLSCAHL